MTRTTAFGLVSLALGVGLLACNGVLARSMLGYWAQNRQGNDFSRALFDSQQHTRTGRLMTSDRFQTWFVRVWWLVVASLFLTIGFDGVT